MYKPKKLLHGGALPILAVSALCFSSISYAATLGQRAVYTVNVLVWDDPTVMGQCSAFTFGDVSTLCASGGNSAFVDNQDGGAPALAGGDGVSGDGFAGTMSIQTGVADSSGNNTFTVLSYQMDPYLGTAGGVFKTTMTPPDGANTGVGTFDALGNMTLDLTGRVGVAEFFEAPPPTSIGIQAWNIDDSAVLAGNGGPVTYAYQDFTTGDSIGYNPNTGGANLTLTGRAIGDANTDGILDAVLVASGNVGAAWGFFDGTPYSEAFNVQFVLVSADPVAVDDAFSTNLLTNLTIDVDNELIAPNDTIADPAETLSFVSLDTSLTNAGSTVTENAGIITYAPNPAFTDPSTDSFTYTIRDVNGETDTATVNITITNAGPPIANDDVVAITEDTQITFDPVAGTASGVVPDSDPIPSEIPGLTISAVDATSLNGGVITQSGNDLTYTPASNFSGPDTFTYTIENSIPLSATATVTVNIAPVNDAPVCTDVDFTTGVDTSLDINIANDLLSTTSLPPLCTDAEDDGLSLASFDSAGSHGGTITNNAGVLQYTPAAGFTGAETFTFTATDGMDSSVPNTITVNVFAASLSNFTMMNAGGNTFGGTNDVVIEWDETSFNSVDDGSTGTGIPADTNFGLMTIASPEPFNDFLWTAHHVRIFKNETGAPITLKFDVTCRASDYDNGDVDCGRPLGEQGAKRQYLTMTLQHGEIGGHILFDWNTSTDIDVVNVWKENASWNTYGDAAPKNALWLGEAGVPPATDATWRLVSSDVQGDGFDNFNGSPMIDGPFLDFFANFNYKPDASGEGLPDIETEISDVDVDKFAFSIELWSLLAGLLSVFGLRRINNKK